VDWNDAEPDADSRRLVSKCTDLGEPLLPQRFALGIADCCCWRGYAGFCRGKDSSRAIQSVALRSRDHGAIMLAHSAEYRFDHWPVATADKAASP
jgi:hypothetical protein